MSTLTAARRARREALERLHRLLELEPVVDQIVRELEGRKQEINQEHDNTQGD